MTEKSLIGKRLDKLTDEELNFLRNKIFVTEGFYENSHVIKGNGNIVAVGDNFKDINHQQEQYIQQQIRVNSKYNPKEKRFSIYQLSDLNILLRK